MKLASIGLSALGIVLAGAAAFYLYSALSMSIEVPVGAETVANMELMHVQEIGVIIGLACALGSIIAITGSAVVSAIEGEKQLH